MNPLFSAQLAALRLEQLSPRTHRTRRTTLETTMWRSAPRPPVER
jgi:hypothetical protein